MGDLIEAESPDQDQNRARDFIYQQPSFELKTAKMLQPEPCNVLRVHYVMTIEGRKEHLLLPQKHTQMMSRKFFKKITLDIQNCYRFLATHVVH